MPFLTYKNELTQVILNILNNSRDAFASHGVSNKKIEIELSCKNSEVVLNIKDNAGGIKESLLLKIFEPYFSTKQKQNGTGLGLYMSKIIVTQHLGGELFAQNTDDGVCFTIKIPMHSKQGEQHG